MESFMLKIMYTLFLGILLAIFVGVGIDTFYPAPKAPESPLSYEVKYDRPLTEEERQAEAAFQNEQKSFMEKLSVYNRNVSIIALVFAVAFLVIGLSLAHRIDVISDGLLLSGVFTLLYSIGRGFAAEDTAYRFMVVSVGVVVALALGYLKFIKQKA